MNIQEAYKLLEVKENISDDDLKSQYKQLAKKYHPDIYKEDPSKFKNINEAYQLINDYRQHPEKHNSNPFAQGFWQNAVNIGFDIFGQTQKKKYRPPAKSINTEINITFHEAVQGCTKPLAYDRNTFCNTCNGDGTIHSKNGCLNCDGFGRKTVANNGIIFQTKCDQCQGKDIKSEDCKTCKATGSVPDKREGNIEIPAGITDGSILRLNGEGNFMSHPMFGNIHTDVLIKINVANYKGFAIRDNDVVSDLNISLLEALQGVDKEIETVYGNKNITIQPKTKHRDTIKIPNAGVKGTPGYHIINLQISYPDDIVPLVKVLNDISNSV